jgi:hypothetical protein
MDLTPVPSQVLPGSGQQLVAKAGEVINAGDAIYLNPATGKLNKASCASPATGFDGIALHSVVAIGHPVHYAHAGQFTMGIGAAMHAGEVLVLSANLGKIARAADLVNTNMLIMAGYCVSNTQIFLQIKATGVTYNTAALLAADEGKAASEDAPPK